MGDRNEKARPDQLENTSVLNKYRVEFMPGETASSEFIDLSLSAYASRQGQLPRQPIAIQISDTIQHCSVKRRSDKVYVDAKVGITGRIDVEPVPHESRAAERTGTASHGAQRGATTTVSLSTVTNRSSQVISTSPQSIRLTRQTRQCSRLLGASTERSHVELSPPDGHNTDQLLWG